MAYHRLRKLMKRTMKIFLDNKLKTRKTSVIKSKRKKLMEVNKKLKVIRKQVRTEVTSLLLKPQIKKRQRELRKERRNCWQVKKSERRNCRRRRESFNWDAPLYVFLVMSTQVRQRFLINLGKPTCRMVKLVVLLNKLVQLISHQNILMVTFKNWKVKLNLI